MRISDWSSDVCSSDLYINPETGKSYPLFLRELRKAFGEALRKTFFEFIRLHTSHNASHFQMLGKTVIEDIVWDIDKELAGYSDQFNLLFLVTPVNLDEAWKAFEKSDFRKRSEEHTSELQSLMRISSAVFCLKKKKI